jgi:hypothetical protein
VHLRPPCPVAWLHCWLHAEVAGGIRRIIVAVAVATGRRVAAYGASFTVADATTLPFRMPISRNATRGRRGFKTTAAVFPSAA